LSNPILYIVLDGVGDLPVPEYGGKTPLEAASTPNLDQLAAKGRMGMVYTVKKGIAPESDAGVFSLLSYDPSRLDLSRGVVEALGSGLDFQDGDLALRCNFATVRDGQIVDRRAGRNLSTEQAKELVESVNESPRLKDLSEFQLKATIGHRCSIVFRSGKFSSAISNLDPGYGRKGKMTVAKSVTLPAPVPKCEALAKTKIAIRTANLVNEFAARAHDLLKEHQINLKRAEQGYLPANFLLMRDAGTKIPKVRKLKDKFRLRSVAIADMPVEIGIAKVIGMETSTFPPDRSIQGYSQRARKAMELARNHDLVYVHLKGPDEPGHDGDFNGKRKSIEDIDAGFFGELGSLEPSVICVTADHSTPCSAKGHTDDPVPILLLRPRVSPDGSMRFTEFYGRAGKLGTLRHGYEILSIITKRRS
jgi:2,3-bisphosphoglycerate-independent phosphoglycerate mutase